MTPFIVYSLPRSRSTWLQHWFCCRDGLAIGHDTAMTCDSVDEFVRLWDRGMTGTIETGAIIGWRLLRELRPGLRTAVVFRPLDEVHASLLKFGIDAREELELRLAMMEELASVPGVMSLSWRELSERDSAKRFWHHCTAERFDEERWSNACGVNIQVDVPKIQEYLSHSVARVKGLKEEVARRTMEFHANGGRMSCQGLN